MFERPVPVSAPNLHASRQHDSTTDSRSGPAASGQNGHGSPDDPPHGNRAGRGPGAPGGGSPFSHAAPEGAAKTVSAVLGEIVWLMSQSPLHKSFFISDLEWFVMPPVILQQFRLYYDTGTPAEPGRPEVAGKPIGVVLWARVDAEVAARLATGRAKLRPQDWRSGPEHWVVEIIAPFGPVGDGHTSIADAMIADLKEKVFPTTPMRVLVAGAGGAREVRVV
jgi:cytolysin-activating lysine-acyltransferase